MTAEGKGRNHIKVTMNQSTYTREDFEFFKLSRWLAEARGRPEAHREKWSHLTPVRGIGAGS